MALSKGRELFEEAVGALLIGQPFYGTLLMKMEHVEDPNIPTLCVNFKQLKYNPSFVEQFSLDEVIFCVAHEVQHLAWQHLPRMKHYIEIGMGPDGKPLNAMKLNRAQDFPINHALVVAGIGTKPSEDKIQICYDPKNFPETMVPEEIYCLLPDDPSDGKGKGGKGQPLDEHDPMTGADDPSAIGPADIVQAAEQHKAIKGEYPAGIERILGQIKKPDVSPWRALRSFITTNLPGFDRSTWRRLQRRQIVRGIGVPGRVAEGAGVIGVVIDTSGSIDEKMLQLFGGHLSAIMADAMPQHVLVYWTDAQVHRVDKVKTPTDLRKLLSGNVPGGGGTDMPEGVRAAEADKVNSVVVLTDGYTDFCDSTLPLMWAITSHAITASGNGRTIHI